MAMRRCPRRPRSVQKVRATHLFAGWSGAWNNARSSWRVGGEFACDHIGTTGRWHVCTMSRHLIRDRLRPTPHSWDPNDQTKKERCCFHDFFLIPTRKDRQQQQNTQHPKGRGSTPDVTARLRGISDAEARSLPFGNGNQGLFQGSERHVLIAFKRRGRDTTTCFSPWLWARISKTRSVA